jgi:hypothetical protein
MSINASQNPGQEAKDEENHSDDDFSWLWLRSGFGALGTADSSLVQEIAALGAFPLGVGIL